MSMFTPSTFTPESQSNSNPKPNKPQSLSTLIELIRNQRTADPERAQVLDKAVATDEIEIEQGESWIESQKRKSSFESLQPKHGKEHSSMFSLSDDGPAKSGRSPGRAHRPLTALSPLQSFSPLQAMNIPHKEKPRSGHRREGSLTRSLSSKERVYASGDNSFEEPYGQNVTSPGGLFSRLTLVRAPSVSSESEQSGMRRRSKSSSSLAAIEALAPFETIPGAPNAVPTTARGPRRSFAASSFSSMTPLSGTPRSLSRNSPFRESHAPADRETQGIQRKTLSPEEVVELAKSLNAPTLDAPPSLQRRKSYGSSSSRQAPAPEPLALEPVEYVQMDEETLLPFADRPAEVRDLIEHPSNQALFDSLKAAFPKSPPRESWAEVLPNEWTYDEFILHLTTLDRVTCPDWAWVTRAREAVRQHSIALWERLGVCLGCDADLLNAGASVGETNWGGLGLNDLDGESDAQSQVWVEALVAGERTPELSMTPTPLEERGSLPELGELSDDELHGGMETIGEDEDDQTRTATTSRQASTDKRPTPAQVAGGRGPRMDPFASPDRPVAALHEEPRTRTRSKSSVGLQIMTSPSLPHQNQFYSPSSTGRKSFIEHDRQIGDPLFISSFSNVGLGPSLGRSASHVEAGPEMMPHAGAYGKSLGFSRKVSGAGLSESAITFATESSYSGHD